MHNVGLTIRAKAYLRGMKEGKAVMYKFGAYPHGSIAPVQFLWQAPPPIDKSTASAEPDDPKSKKVVKLWIWCHPAAQKSVLAELKSTISAHNKASPECSPGNGGHSEVAVAVRDLVRFRLTGPRSHALLMETLKPVWYEGTLPADSPKGDIGPEDKGSTCELDSDENDNLDPDEELPEPPAVEKWWLGEYEPQLVAHGAALAKEYTAIKAATEPAQFSRGAVLGLCVQDPRLFTPSKMTDMVSAFYPRKKKKGMLSGLFDQVMKERVEIDSESEGDDDDDGRLDSVVPEVAPCVNVDQPMPPSNSLPPDLSFSPIWDAAVCGSVSNSKASGHYLNQKRSKKLVRTSELSLGSSAPQIPVLLIQQSPPSSSAFLPQNHNPLGAGWDLVLPPEWATPFLVSLEYRGARVCGMRELHKCSLESLSLHFPHDFPDTYAGSVHNSNQRKELEARYIGKPPDKRRNFGKLLVPTPFHCPWDDLVRVWSRNCRSSSDDYPRGLKRLAECAQQGVLSKRIKLDGCFEHAPDKELVIADEKEGVVPNAYTMATCPAFYVVRSREDLNSLRHFIESVVGGRRKSNVCPECIRPRSDTMRSSVQKFAIDSLLERHANGLVAVQVIVHTSGIIKCLDSISLPDVSDLRTLLASNAFCPFTGPSEKINKNGMSILGKEGLVFGTSPLQRKEMKVVKKITKGALYCNVNVALL